MCNYPTSLHPAYELKEVGTAGDGFVLWSNSASRIGSPFKDHKILTLNWNQSTCSVWRLKLFRTKESLLKIKAGDCRVPQKGFLPRTGATGSDRVNSEGLTLPPSRRDIAGFVCALRECSGFGARLFKTRNQQR